ncbi:hypothetical protein [Ornithinicoccus hortensis]|uniref:Polyketide cyclase/dehydrase/lipid transport protein n=1 Tax=Ornithinicoccus hortensis TaxID=82346 RepID=A0A542YUQ7_9MICO|nr:hypothetical protein [Ornithinicoccus hortensis]TQL51816.1 hypothetical protein FB467_2979 [Ornithinicoccus hortensis]
MRFELRTIASPEQVRHALTVFTDERPRIWDRTLDPSTFELRDQGPDWAVAKESTPRSPFWVVARYDWSDPDVVRWTVVDSSYGGGGTGSVRIAPDEAGGSRVSADWDAPGGRPLQKPLLFLIHHGPMPLMIRRMWKAALDRYAEEQAAG